VDVCYLLRQLLLLPQELEPQLLPQELESQLLRELEPQPEPQLSLQLHSSRQPAEPYVSPKPQIGRASCRERV